MFNTFNKPAHFVLGFWSLMDKVDYETYDSNNVYDSMEPSSAEKKVIVFGVAVWKKGALK